MVRKIKMGILFLILPFFGLKALGKSFNKLQLDQVDTIFSEYNNKHKGLDAAYNALEIDSAQVSQDLIMIVLGYTPGTALEEFWTKMAEKAYPGGNGIETKRKVRVINFMFRRFTHGVFDFIAGVKPEVTGKLFSQVIRKIKEQYPGKVIICATGEHADVASVISHDVVVDKVITINPDYRTGMFAFGEGRVFPYKLQNIKNAVWDIFLKVQGNIKRATIEDASRKERKVVLISPRFSPQNILQAVYMMKNSEEE